MTTTLLLIRHGETPWNALGKVQGVHNIDLSEAGIMQAKCLRDRLQGNFTAVYSSPLNRAYDTACIPCENTDLEPIKVNDLREIDFGSWESMTFKEIAHDYPNHFATWKADDETGPMYDGEGSTYNASIRGKNCIEELIRKHPNETIAVVSHGGFIKATLIGLFGWKMSMYHHFALGNTCITTINFNAQLSPMLIGLNDTNHLTEKVTSV